MDLEFRIAASHVGQGKITSVAVVQHFNEFWSYCRKLPEMWAFSSIDRRTDVAARLLQNLRNSNGIMDLSPLTNDQRASGFIYGSNSLQEM